LDPPSEKDSEYEGRKRWTLTLLESAMVELNIVDRASASDNTIGAGGRPKKHAEATSAEAMGDPPAKLP
jgi:hypothetical protein